MSLEPYRWLVRHAPFWALTVVLAACLSIAALPADAATIFAHQDRQLPATLLGQPNISGLDFFPDSRPHPNFGFSAQRWWAEQDIPASRANSPLFLELDAPIADRLAAFMRCNGARWVAIDHLAGRKNQFFLGNPGQGCLLLLMQESHSGIQFDSVFMTAGELSTQAVPIWIGLTLGVSLTISGLSLMLWISARARELPYFILYQLCSCIVITMVWGATPDHPLIGTQGLSDFVGVAALNAWVLGYLGFMRAALRFHVFHPRLDRRMDLLWIVFIVTAACRAFGSLLTGPLTVLILLGSTACYWVVIAQQWKVERRRTIQQLLGFSPSIIGSVLFCIMLGGGVAQNDLRALYLIGQVTSTLALGFWIASAFKKDRDTREAVLTEHVEALKDNRRQLQRYQEDLEDMVAARTRELQRALSSERAIVEQQRDFTAMIGHEFRTPLAVIDGQARRIGIAGNAESDLLRRAREIRDAVGDMIGLMDGLLFHAREDRGAAEYRFETVHVRDIIQQAIATSLPRPRQIDLCLACDETIRVRADRILLSTAFGNLIGNAAKYSREGSRLDISCQCLGEAFELAFADCGAGIPPADIGTIFARFQRGSNVLGTSGSGLGLFITRQVVEAHGGTIQARSVLGQGSVFTIRLPRAMHAS